MLYDRQLEEKATSTPWAQWLTRAGIGLLLGATTRKGILALADQSVASVTNFLTGVIIGRACAKEEFGLYMLGFTIALFFTGLQNALITSPYTVYSPRLRGSAHTRYTGSTLIHQLGVSALAILFLVVGGTVLSLGLGPQGLAPVVWALVVVITFIMLRDYARRVCFAGLRMKTTLVLDSCVAVVQISGLLLLAHLGVLSASHAYWVIGTACGIAAVGWLIRSRKRFTLGLSDSLSDLRRNWSFGKWLFAGSLVYMGSIQLYPWLLTGFHGTAATGILGACMGVLFFANPFLMGMGNLLAPKTAHAFADGGVKELRRIVLNSTLVFAGVMGLFCLCMLFFGGLVVALMYGDKYGGNGVVVAILALGQLVQSLTLPLGLGLLAMERSDVTFKSYLLALGVTFTLGLWLVKALGPLGVACGLLAGNIAAATVKYLVFAALVRSDVSHKPLDIGEAIGGEDRYAGGSGY